MDFRIFKQFFLIVWQTIERKNGGIFGLAVSHHTKAFDLRSLQVDFYSSFDLYRYIFCELRVISWSHYPTRDYYSKLTIWRLLLPLYYICFTPFGSLYWFSSELYNSSPSNSELRLWTIFVSWSARAWHSIGAVVQWCSCNSIPGTRIFCSESNLQIGLGTQRFAKFMVGWLNVNQVAPGILYPIVWITVSCK